MKKRFFCVNRTLSIITAITLVATMILPPVSLTVSAAIDGVDPIIDPTVASSLPASYEQEMKDGMPNGVFIIGNTAISSYGIASDSTGSIYYADYSGKIVKKSPDKLGYVSLLSEATTIQTGVSNLFSIAINSENNIVFGKDSDSGNGYVGIYNQTTKAKQTIIPNLTRPRQIALDKNDNVYVACENGEIKKWEKSTGTVSLIAPTLAGAQGIAVLPDGTAYVLCYSKHSDTPLIGVSYKGGKLYQINNNKAIAVIGGDTQYIWRARGITTDENGYLYLTGESNAWDNGNSSLMARFNPGTKEMSNVLTGLDYATYSTYSKDGRFYMPLARDGYLTAYSEKAAANFVEQTWSNVSNTRISTYGGSYVQNSDPSANLTINISSLSLKGTVSVSNGSNKVCGWVKVPAEALPEISKTMIPHPSEIGMPGMYHLPTATATATSGQTATAVIPLRTHVSARWPMQDLYTANANFSEAPEAYLVYFEWTPYDLSTYEPEAGKVYDEFINDSLEPAGKPVIGNGTTEYDFSNSSAAIVKADTITNITFNGSNAYTISDGNQISFKFRWANPSFDWMGIAIDNKQVSGLGDGQGLRAVFWKSVGNITCRVIDSANGKGWDAVAATQTLMDGSLASEGFSFNNNDWHTFTMTSDNGVWSIYVDGYNVIRNRYSNLDSDLTSLVGGNATNLSIYTSNNTGSVDIEQIIPETPSQSQFDFSASDADVTKAGDVNIIDFKGSNAYTLCTGSDVSFKFRMTTPASYDWLGVSLDNTGASGLGGGNGIRSIFWKSAYSVTARVVETSVGKGWDAVAGTQTLMDGALDPSDSSANGGQGFGDGNWHTVTVSQTNDVWSMKVDGYEILRNKYAACDSDLTRFLSGADQTYLTFYSGSSIGGIEVEQIENSSDTTIPVMDFSGSEATTSKIENITSINFNGHSAYALSQINGLDFKFRWIDATFDWMGLAIDNTQISGLGDGVGLRGIFWKPVPNSTMRVVNTPGGLGWDAAAATQTLMDGPVAGTEIPGYSFNDGNWHTFAVAKTDGVWSIKLDGYELIKNRYAGLDAQLDNYFSGTGVYVNFFSSSNTGKLEIEQTPKVVVNKTTLLNKIASATDLYDTTAIGDRPGQISQSQHDSLKTAIDAAQAVAENDAATSDDVLNSIAALQQAIYNFTIAIVPTTDFSELTAKINEAQALKDKTGIGEEKGQAPQTAHTAFATAISAALTVKNNTQALQAEVNQALGDLNSAIDTFISKIIVSNDIIPFDFIGANCIGGNAVGTVTQGTKGVDISLPQTGSNAYTLVSGTNLEFQFKINPDQAAEWVGFNLANNGNTMLGGGNGVSTLLWTAQYAVTSRVVEDIPGKGWDAAAATKQIHDGGLNDSLGRNFRDGEWHTVFFGKTETGWVFTIDGIDVIQNRYAGFDADMDRLLGGSNQVTMTMFTNGTAETISVYQESAGNVVSFTALDLLIDNANTLLSETDARIPQTAVNALQSAVDTANALKQNSTVTQNDVDSQKITLAAAIDVYKKVMNDSQKTHQLSSGMDALGTVITEENVYDAILLMDTYLSFTAEQKALLPAAELERLNQLMEKAYAILRTQQNVTISGSSLPFNVKLAIDSVATTDSKWDTVFGNTKLPVALFTMGAENYLTGAGYELGSEGSFEISYILPSAFATYSKFKISQTNADGSVKTFDVTAKDGVLKFTAASGGTFAISAYANSDSNPQTSDNLSATLCIFALLAMLSAIVIGMKSKKSKA